MSRVLVATDTSRRELPLAATTVLGRHPSCTWVLPQPEIPSFWVELRWSTAGWLWRELGGDARGPRKRIAGQGQDWWLLGLGQRINGRSVVIELLDGGAPEHFAVGMDSGEILRGNDLLLVVREECDGIVPADWEHRTGTVEPLIDGETFTVAGRRWRFHAAQATPATAQRQLDLLRHSCRLELRLEAGQATLLTWDGPVERADRGAYLWALVPYIEARLADTPAGGWLTLDEAHQRWLELRPGATSGLERIGQDRSRCARALHALGVAHHEALFERRRLADRWQVRVGPEPARLSLQIADEG